MAIIDNIKASINFLREEYNSCYDREDLDYFERKDKKSKIMACIILFQHFQEKIRKNGGDYNNVYKHLLRK